MTSLSMPPCRFRQGGIVFQYLILLAGSCPPILRKYPGATSPQRTPSSRPPEPCPSVRIDLAHLSRGQSGRFSNRARRMQGHILWLLRSSFCQIRIFVFNTIKGIYHVLPVFLQRIWLASFRPSKEKMMQSGILAFLIGACLL